jgi:hypothetical protein
MSERSERRTTSVEAILITAILALMALALVVSGIGS